MPDASVLLVNRQPVAEGSIPERTVNMGGGGKGGRVLDVRQRDDEGRGSPMTGTAHDPGGEEARRRNRMTVHQPSQPPRVSTEIPNQTVGQRETVWFLAFSYFEDADGNRLEYSVASSDESIASVDVSGSKVTIAGEAPGVTAVTVTARDRVGLEATQQVRVTVERINRRPEAAGSIPEQTVNVGEEVTLDVSLYFSDPDGDRLEYEAQAFFESRASVSMSGSLMKIIAVSDGSTSITVTARGPDGKEAWQRTRVTVETGNRAPEAVGTIPAWAISEGDMTKVLMRPYFSDPDGDRLEYAVATSDPGVAVASLLGTNVWVTGVAAGNAIVTVTARDPDGLEAAQEFGVSVGAANRWPEAQGTIPEQTVHMHDPVTVDVSSYFSDPDGDDLDYEAELFLESKATVSMSGSMMTIVGVSDGRTSLTVTARDPGGLEVQQRTSVTISSENRAPEAEGSIPDQTLDERTRATVDAYPYFRDPDGDQLAYRTKTPNASVATASVSTDGVLTITGVAPGSATVTVVASDPDGLEAEQEAAVTVKPLKGRPQAKGRISAQTITTGETASLSVSSYFDDPDGDRLEHTVTTSDTAVATASVSGTTVSVTGVAAGTATVTVAARDPVGLEATQEIRVTVERVNRRPEAVGSIPEQTVNVGEEVTVEVSSCFSDPDGDPLEYEALPKDELVVVSMSGSVATIAGVSDGVTGIVVTARDPDGLMVPQFIGVAVTQPNRAPEAVNTIPAQAVTVDKTAALVDVSSYFSDPDEDALEYSAVTSDTSVATASVSGDIVTIAGVAAGSATVTVSARDPEGLEAEQSFAVTVWGEDGVTGTVTSCRVVNRVFVRRLRIMGKVRAHRAVRDVEVHGYIDGAYAGVSKLGDLAAGEEKSFDRTKPTALPVGRPRCSITIKWRDLP